jgi:transcription antitermination factor NusG
MKLENRGFQDISVSTIAAHGPVILPKLTGNNPAWFALYVQVNHEKEVVKRLQQKSIECFLPLMERWSKRRDRRKKLQTPVFPGYIFIHTILDNYTNLDILKTPGVVFILKNSEGAIPIPGYQIDSLKTVLRKPEGLVLHPSLKKGDWVRVVRGPLAGCIGILARQDPKKGRLVVNVDIIRQAVSVELDVEDVQPTAPPSG